ncbi:uncharacterized protein LOC129716778 [Wyeomyia smithii]|uniref:uncharacterized protein LOC129716778 n=1 Tax=Wyeomyia smithii TaxID=174621 RepID=UPI002468104E|nr:uncharacterized protein LOC129716778 [Wyeomyia smithii]
MPCIDQPMACVAIKETQESQTKEHLKALIEDVLNDYNVNLNKVYSITYDNGANMVASVNEIKKIFEAAEIKTYDSCFNEVDQVEENTFHYEEQPDDENIFVSSIFDEEENLEDDDDVYDDFSNGRDGETTTPEATTMPDDNFDVTMVKILDSIRCAAHTAQLAVWDVVKPYGKRIFNIQKLVVKLRQQKYYKFIKLHEAHLPPLSNKTRWNSTFAMLKSLLTQKPFFGLIKKTYPEIDFTTHWKFIEKFCEAFVAPFVLTLQLQKHHVALSEFYACWLLCQAKLTKLVNNSLAQKLLKAFRRRLEKITASMQFKACLYLDPRFNFLGSKRISSLDKELIQEFLIKIHRRVDGVVDEFTTLNDTEDELEKILSDFFNEDPSINTNVTNNMSFIQKLKKLEMRDKTSIIDTINSGPSKSKDKKNHLDLLKYWEVQKYTNPDLYKIAMIVLSSSATQVSVERGFSALKLMLSDRRMNLSAESVANSLLLKLNPDLLPQITQAMSEEDG